MTRGILIAGNESALSVAVAAETAKRVEQFAVAFISNRLSDSAGEKLFAAAEQVIPIQWKPDSPVSARTLILAAENRLEYIHEAIVICAPPALRKAPSDLSSSDIEIMVNDNIKGWFYIVKELTYIFKLRQSGTLALVLSEQDGLKEESLDVLSPAATAAFRAFGQNIVANSQDEHFNIMGFSAPQNSDNAQYASFIFKTIEERNRKNNGKWHKFGGKPPKSGLPFFPAKPR